MSYSYFSKIVVFPYSYHTRTRIGIRTTLPKPNNKDRYMPPLRALALGGVIPPS